MADQTDSMENNKLDDNIRRAMDILTKPENRQVQENIFVRHFLPLFAGKFPPGTEIPIARWLDIAGHPHAAVDVYRGTEYLYTVPPMLVDAKLRELKGRDQSMFQIITTAQQKYNVMPRLGEEHMRYWLTDRVEQNQIDIEQIQQWNSIFTRYGYEPIVVIEAAKEQEVSKNVKPPIQDFEEM